MATTKKSARGGKVALAVGVAAAALGAYWLFGSPHAAKHRKMAKSWILKARAEIMDAVEKVGDVNKTAYHTIVDQVMKKYSDAKMSPEDITRVTKEMKTTWKHATSKKKK